MLSRLLSGPQELFSNMESPFPTTPHLLVQESTPLRLVQALGVAI